MWNPFRRRRAVSSPTGFYWHMHHDILMEPLMSAVEDRIEFIEKYKPEHEQELRLRLLKPVRGMLPVAVTETWDAYGKASAAWDEAGKHTHRASNSYKCAQTAYDKAWGAYSIALREYADEIEVLHAAECPDCPWDGYTIFSEGS